MHHNDLISYLKEQSTTTETSGNWSESRRGFERMASSETNLR